MWAMFWASLHVTHVPASSPKGKKHAIPPSSRYCTLILQPHIKMEINLKKFSCKRQINHASLSEFFVQTPFTTTTTGRSCDSNPQPNKL